MLRQREAGRAGEAEDEDEEIAGMRDGGQARFFHRDDLASEVHVAAAAESVHEVAAEQAAIGHDRALDAALVGIENPEVLLRTAMQDKLVADGGAGLPEPQHTHTAGEKLIGLVRERSVGSEFDHGNGGLLGSAILRLNKSHAG
jgi:hypothetical protein